MVLSLIGGGIVLAFAGVSTLFVRELNPGKGGCKDCYRDEIILDQRIREQRMHDEQRIREQRMHDEQRIREQRMHDERMEVERLHAQMMHDKKIQEQYLQIIRDQIMHSRKISEEEKNRMDKIIESQFTIINNYQLFIMFLVGVVVVFLLVFLWYCYLRRYRNSYKGDHKGLPYGSTPCHCHMTGTTEGTSVQSQAFRMKKIERMVRRKGEKFSQFLNRVWTRASDLSCDGRVSAEMREEAMVKALRNNMPLDSLFFTLPDMNPDDLVQFAEDYFEDECASGLQFYQDQQQEVSFSSQNGRLSCSSRMKTITKRVISEGETFTLFLTRLRIEADDLNHDGRLSDEMVERAVKLALMNNLPEECLAHISAKMTSDDMVRFVDGYLKYQHGPRFQFQDQQQEVLTNQHLTLPVAARIEKITSMVRIEGETFDLFHTRLRIGADDLGDDGRLSAEMKEEAVQQALWDNVPRDCLSFISEDMTPDEMVTIVDVYHKHQTPSGFQYHKQQPASRLHYHHIKREE